MSDQDQGDAERKADEEDDRRREADERKAKRVEVGAWACLVLGLALAAILVIVAAAGHWGEPLGDTIGGLTGTAFALAGVLMFYAALIYQRIELSLQRKDLRKSTGALVAQREEMERQREEMKRGQKATATLSLVHELEDQKRGRVQATRFLRDYYKTMPRGGDSDSKSNRHELNRRVGVDSHGILLPEDFEGAVESEFAAQYGATPRGGIPGPSREAHPIADMFSLLATCRLAWVLDLADHGHLAQALKPEVTELKKLYKIVYDLGGPLLDRYRDGHDWLVEVAIEAQSDEVEVG